MCTASGFMSEGEYKMTLRKLGTLYHCMSRGQIGKWMCMILAAVAVLEFLFLNLAILYVYRAVNNELSEITSSSPGMSFFDKLQNNRKFSNFLKDAKKSGVFTTLLQETLERLYVVHENREGVITGNKMLVDETGKSMKELSFIGIDVSHSREATYIYNRIAMKEDFPYHFLVVDIGTNDGFISSNSFNFIQWGWDAVLVEPQPGELQTAQNNIKQYIDKYSDGKQSVKLVQAAIGRRDGTVEFVVTRASQGAESHIRVHDFHREGDSVVTVPSLTVKTLAKNNNIPKNFGLLSIDAEGMGAEILKQWIAQGFTPAYIIFEHLHRQEPLSVTMDYLKKHDYKYLGTRGWNLIFEHQSPEESVEQ